MTLQRFPFNYSSSLPLEADQVTCLHEQSMDEQGLVHETPGFMVRR